MKYREFKLGLYHEVNRTGYNRTRRLKDAITLSNDQAPISLIELSCYMTVFNHLNYSRGHFQSNANASTCLARDGH